MLEVLLNKENLISKTKYQTDNKIRNENVKKIKCEST